MPRGRKTDGNSRSSLKAKYDAHNVVLDKTYGAWADLRRELSDSRTVIEERKALLDKFARCSDSQSAFLLLDDYFEQISLSRRDFAGNDWWTNLLKSKGKARLEAIALLFLRAKRPLPAELMAYTNRDRLAALEEAEKMIIEDAVEDYVIYAYFELDHPRRCYVGKTLQSRAEQRDQEHRSGESGAPKFNAFVQNEIIYGNRDFDEVLRYEVLEHFTGTAQECAEKEGEHIRRKNSIENGWNLKPEGTGNGLLFPSPTPSQHKNRPQLRRSKLHIQGDLGEEIIQDAIEFGLEQSILEKDKEYTLQELKTLIAKSYVAHANKTLNLTVQEPSPDEIKSVLNDWTKLKNSKNFYNLQKWWEGQLKKSGFERPLDWKNIPNIIREAYEKAPSYSPIIHWLKGDLSMPTDALFERLPKLDKKWACYNTSPDDDDVWRLIKSAYLAKFPNTLQEIAEKEEAARLEREKEEQARIQRELRIQEAKEIEQERLQREREEQARREKESAKEREKESMTWWDRFCKWLWGYEYDKQMPPHDITHPKPQHDLPKSTETLKERIARWGLQIPPEIYDQLHQFEEYSINVISTMDDILDDLKSASDDDAKQDALISAKSTIASFYPKDDPAVIALDRFNAAQLKQWVRASKRHHENFIKTGIRKHTEALLNEWREK